MFPDITAQNARRFESVPQNGVGFFGFSELLFSRKGKNLLPSVNTPNEFLTNTDTYFENL